MSAGPEEEQTYAFPASFGQQRLWLAQQRDTHSSAYNMAGGIRLRGVLDPVVLHRCVLDVLDRHEALRTSLELTADGTLAQIVHPTVAADLPVRDLTGRPSDEVGELVAAAATAPFDLAVPPLLRCLLVRIGADDHRFVVVLHHAVADGWSLGLLLRELGERYQAYAAGSTPQLPEPTLQYPDWAVWQRDQSDQGAFDGELAYWREHLDGAAAPPLPAAGAAMATGRVPVEFPEQLMAAVCELAETERATPYIVLLTALMIVLARWTDEQDVVVGVPVAGRGRPETLDLVGCLVNTLAIRARIDLDGPFRRVLHQVRDVCLAGYRHQDVPFEQVTGALRTGAPLVRVLFALREMPARLWPDGPGLSGELFEAPDTDAQFDLSVHVARSASGGWSGHALLRPGLFPGRTAARFLAGLPLVLHQALAEPERAVGRLALVPDAEQGTSSGPFSGAGVAPVADGCLHSLFEAQADRTPDAIAVHDGAVSVRYAELDADANRLAHHLLGLGVRRGDLVGVCLPRSADMVVALLAVLKAGAAYVPLDPSYPHDRLTYMARDARLAVVLTDTGGAETFPDIDQVVRLDAVRDTLAGCATARPGIPVVPQDLAYVLYTSGSTGRPKGAMNPHRAVVNRICWAQQEYQLVAGEGVLQKTPLSFDVSGWELHWPLLVGGRMVLAAPDGHRDPDHLIGLVADRRVSTLHFVPSMLREFLAHPGVPVLAGTLRRILCSGEELPADLVHRCARTLPGVELHNLYGPTEAAIDVTAHRCLPGPLPAASSRVPIGRPIAGARVAVLDSRGEPVPVGAAGELHLGGVPVGWGYWRRPALTAERFVPDPALPGARLYRTGDRVVLGEDGAITWLERLDNQVKVHGVRIECGEVASVLRGLDGVLDAAVVLAAGTGRLAGYLTTVDGQVPDLSALTDELRTALPPAMVPDTLTHLAELPLGPSGKLDRSRLPAPDVAAGRRTIVAASTPLEMIFAGIWSEVLGLAEVGVRDDFYELGGDSLRAMAVLARARRHGLVVPMPVLLGNHTIADIASAVATA